MCLFLQRNGSLSKCREVKLIILGNNEMDWHRFHPWGRNGSHVFLHNTYRALLLCQQQSICTESARIFFLPNQTAENDAGLERVHIVFNFTPIQVQSGGNNCEKDRDDDGNDDTDDGVVFSREAENQRVKVKWKLSDENRMLPEAAWGFVLNTRPLFHLNYSQQTMPMSILFFGPSQTVTWSESVVSIYWNIALPRIIKLKSHRFCKHLLKLI